MHTNYDGHSNNCYFGSLKKLEDFRKKIQYEVKITCDILAFKNMLERKINRKFLFT